MTTSPEGKAPFVSHDGIVINSSIDATKAKGDSLTSTACAWTRPSTRSTPGSNPPASARAPSATVCATGCSAASATGASRSRSSTARTAPAPASRRAAADQPAGRAGLQSEDLRPGGRRTQAPLSREDWVRVELDLGDGKKTYYRDTNTMPNWAGSLLVLHALPRPDRHQAHGGEGRVRLLDGSGPGRPAGKSGVDPARRPNTPCCTCCTPASGTRCCSTSATSTPWNRSTSCSTRAWWAYAYTDDAASTCRPPGVVEEVHRRQRRADVHMERPACQPRVRQDGQEPEEHHHA